MVLISEIAEEAQKKDGDPKEGDGDETGEAAGDVPGEPELELVETPQEVQPAAVVPDDPAHPPLPPLSEGLKADPPAPPAPPAAVAAGKALPNEYALRVAYIMRSYLYMRQGGGGEAASAAAASSSAAGDDRCRAMMEVVRKENGRWSVSRVMLEHTHDLIPQPDPAGTLASLVPTVGMEFDSISAAKAYYGAYSEKMGFQMKTGSGKRSRGNRMLIMQRLSCSKGHFPALNAAASNAAKKQKRCPYKKGAEAAEARKEGEAVEVIQVESSTEKGGMLGDDHRGEVQSGSSNGVKEGVKVPLLSNPAQSRLLRELGVRVSRYTSEERRNIILKYMQKRNNRQVVDRSIKIPSRQALAERRQRGVGGKFLSREETQCRQLSQDVEPDNTAPKDGCDFNSQSTSLNMQSPKTTPVGDHPLTAINKQEEATEDEPELPEEVVANAGGVPIVGMIFENEDKAYDYYIKYASSVGFSVRKGWWDRSAKNVTRSRVYVCSREGFRSKHDAKRPRPETRTGCPARMAIKVTSSGKYRVTEFVPDHNHQLVAPLDIQMLSSRKVLTKIQHIGCQNANLIPAGYKNYLRAKRSKDMHSGDSGALLQYFQKMKSDNPSFYYAIQVDEYDQITNIFWADAKSIMDYHYFGDIVCFDSTYKAHGYDRPLALFLGLNHHKQVIVFAAAFLYDESLESFKWLFESFKMAMSGKQPKMVLTEQSTAMNDAIAAVWPNSFHRLCAFQMYHNTVKQLGDVFQGSESFAHDFSHCLYDVEDEEEFLLAWKLMIEKYGLQDNEWLNKLSEEKGSWSFVYDKQAFSGDIANALRAENLSSVLKDNLNLEKDLSTFLKLYEILLEERRFEELQADFHANQGTPRIPPLPLLWQAVNAYTPAVFEIFKREFEIFLNCMIFSCVEVGTISEYQVTVKEKNKIHYVRFDASDCSAICSCRKFESIGIQCCHVLKVLDIRNIKELPPHYFLKRWRKDAKAGSLRGDDGMMLDGNPTSLSKRYSSLCRVLFQIAAKAAENVDTFVLMVNHSDQLLEQVDRILQTNHIEKSSVINTSKDQTHNLVESGSAHYDNGNEVHRLSGKKKNGSVRRKLQNETEVNKRQKTRKGQSDEAEVAPRDDESQLTPSTVPSQARNPSNQFLGPNNFMQAPFVSPHQFGLGSAQGFHPMAQFGQDASTSSLQQQPFHGNSHFSQGFPPPDINPLQFIGSNPQIDHQNSDQGHCSIPVWDFL